MILRTGMPRLFRLFLLVVLLDLAAAPARAQDEAHREFEPSAFPDRIVLTWSGSPSTTQAVTWRTDSSVEQAFGEIALADASPAFAGRARSVPASTDRFKSDGGMAHYHSVVFDELVPDTLYAYRVGDGEHWSEWFHFRTASAEPEPFSFIYFGDAQTDLLSLWSRAVRGAFAEAPRARFMIHAGDLINRATHDWEWGEWFEAGSWIHATVPSIPVPGNHEYYRSVLPPFKRISDHWRPQFTLPGNGVEGLEETNYYIDYQGVRVIALNSNERLPEQAAWLEEVLSNNPNRWTVVTFHHPVFSSGAGRDNQFTREHWKPLFDRYRVDLVLQGHDHTYARGQGEMEENLPTGVSARDGGSGTVYVVSVSGPKMYELGENRWAEHMGRDKQLFQVVSVDGDRLQYKAYTVTGQVFDAFDLVKQDNVANRMEDRIAARPTAR